jgi:hypothetical protein
MATFRLHDTHAIDLLCNLAECSDVALLMMQIMNSAAERLPV